MNIRRALAADIPAIVNLLKLSLGESLMPKSETFWNWKHVENPFGVSPVLIAEEGSEPIGVRAFMRWEWQWKGTVLRAVRAVDTATHPAHQGKGIFTELSLALAAQCKEEGVHFIFNTPNQASKPGYLKMGWELAGRMPVRIELRIPGRSRIDPEDPNFSLAHCLSHSVEINQLLAASQNQESNMTTRYTTEYLRWRYLLNPNIRYFASARFSGASSFLFVFRTKANRFGNELRICDVFLAGSDALKDWKDAVQSAARQAGAGLVTMVGRSWTLPLINRRLNIGPEVTVRKLNPTPLSLLSFDNWRPSLGDMEVF